VPDAGDPDDQVLAHIDEVLDQIVPLGDKPSERELELAQSVARHVSGRKDPSSGRLIVCPTCHGSGKVPGGEP
jgi:hypothetical protein